LPSSVTWKKREKKVRWGGKKLRPAFSDGRNEFGKGPVQSGEKRGVSMSNQKSLTPVQRQCFREEGGPKQFLGEKKKKGDSFLDKASIFLRGLKIQYRMESEEGGKEGEGQVLLVARGGPPSQPFLLSCAKERRRSICREKKERGKSVLTTWVKEKKTCTFVVLGKKSVTYRV